MANLGVSIDEVWQQGSLVSAPPTGPKRSKYTVPIDPTQQHQQQIQEYYGNNNGRSSSRPEYDPEYQQKARAEYMDSIPISRPPQPASREMQYVQAPPNIVSAPPVSSEIPYLKEQLTQQSNTVMDCQKEMYYMKAIINQLKKELNESRMKSVGMSKEERRKQWGYILWMLLITLLLVVVLVILVQLSNQFKKIMNTSLMA